MWLGRPATSIPPATEPLAIVDARTQCRLDAADASQDQDLNVYIAAARGRIERHCGIRLITQTLVMSCSAWSDLDRLPVGIVQSVSSVAFGAGSTPFVGAALASPGALYPSMQLAAGQNWPTLDPSTVITLTATAGFGSIAALPPDIVIAMRLLVSHYFDNRGPVSVGDSQVLPIPGLLDDILADWKRMVLF